MATTTDRLNVNDLKEVKNATWEVRSRWYDLGIELDIHSETLEVLKQDHHGDTDSCFRGLLTHWLSRTSPLPTWSALITAIKSPSISYVDVANEIERKLAEKKQLRPASSPTPEKANSLFSKPVVYHASVCCLSVNKSAHNACSNFIKHDIGHCFKEVSISRSQVGRYLIAIQDSTYFIAFQGEPDFAQWPKKYKSFSEGFCLGGLLACSVYTKIWDSPNISPHIKENLVCITFGQPHIPVPGLDDLAEDYPDIVNTIHAVQLMRDLVPRVLGLLHQHESFEDTCRKLKQLTGQGPDSQTCLTDSAKGIPAIKEPLTYHLLFSGSEGLVLEKTTSEGISSHPSYQLERIKDDMKFKLYLREKHSMEVYSKQIINGYLTKAPEYMIPPKQLKRPLPVQALKPCVKSVDLVNHECELNLLVEGSNLWFYNELKLEDGTIEPVPRILESTGTCLRIQISRQSDYLKSLKDGQKVTIGFHTHFSSHWAMDVEYHTKAYARNRRQEQLAKLTPSEVIELSYLNALLEYQPQHSAQPLSDRMTAIRKFLEEVVKVVPLESIGYSVAYGDKHTKQQCAKALDTLRDLSPSKMMIDALTKAKLSCDSCSSALRESEAGLRQMTAHNPTGNCLCSLITRLLDMMGMPDESTGIISGQNLKALYPMSSSTPDLKSPLDTLWSWRKSLSGTGKATNNCMLTLVNEIRQQELAVCTSLLGSFMDQQEIEIPLSRSNVNQLNVSANATVGVRAIVNLDLERMQTLVEESPGEEFIVKFEAYVRNIIREEDRRAPDDEKCTAKLQFIAQGSRKTVTCSTECISYHLEKQLAELCKDKPAIHPDNLENLVSEWDKIFEKNILSLVAKTHRPMMARWLNWSLMVHNLRIELAKYTTIGVVGPVNCGKSTLVKALFTLDMMSSDTACTCAEEKQTSVPFIYNLKRKMEGLDEGLDIDVVDLPGIDDKDESFSDLSSLLLHLVQIVIFVVNYEAIHTESCKQWLNKLQASSAPLLVCVTHSDKLYEEVKEEIDMDPNGKLMERKFQTLSKSLQLSKEQTVMFCSFRQEDDSVLNCTEGRKKLKEVGIKSPMDVGDWVAKTFKKDFKQRDVAEKLKDFMSSSLEQKNLHSM